MAVFLITVFLADDDDLYAVDMALLSANYVVAADPAAAVAAFAHFGSVFFKRDALARFSAGGINSEPYGVGRRSFCLDALYSLV